MASKRTVVLIGILLALILAYVSQPYLAGRLSGVSRPVEEPPLPGENSISALKVSKDAQGTWIAEFDYFFTGDPRGASLRLGVSKDVDDRPQFVSRWVQAKRGRHHLSLPIQRAPLGEQTFTKQVVAQIVYGQQILASERISRTIDWPDFETWSLDQELRGKSTDELLKQAVQLIDNGDQHSLAKAKRILERLTTKDPRFDSGYIELARVAMKTNWGTEGLHQAETLLSSALQINPESANAKILLGYVYTHQKRYKDAEKLFLDASPAGNRNLWLWANWGELLAVQGKVDQAVEKYREAITRPRTHDTYDRARLDAFKNLIAIAEQKRDLAAVEALHKQRVDEFGNARCDCRNQCYSAEYSRFLLKNRDDTPAAIAMARQALDSNCSKDEAREALGLAYYVAWANDTSEKRSESISQARVFLPTGPKLLYLLATSDRTVTAAKQLVAEGESIDQRDNEKRTALALALGNRDVQSARRLLKLGARADATVGFNDMPAALIPVVSVDLEGIRLMRQFGMDYAKVRFGGITAIDHAKQTGNRKLLQALDPKMFSL